MSTAKSTTQMIKDRNPDLPFVSTLRVSEHPKYKTEDIRLKPSTTNTLPLGHAKEVGRKKMKVDTILHRDTPIAMRDGIKIYADIFHPVSSDQVATPAIICWSPYGKLWSGLDNIYHRSGVPKDWTSGYETFEGLDPAEWCRRGYAIVNVDARGTQFSEGTYFFWGQQESEDVYDTIDFLSRQPWCNGSVAMAGNSYLAKAQVNYASRQKHPALKALAPWEGFNDIYRQLFRRGGVPMNNSFAEMYQGGISSLGEVEDIVTMIKTHPFYDHYWEDKTDDVTKIDVPMYLLGSFGNPFHVYGTLDTFRRSPSAHKWLRVHSTFEWYEQYETKSTDDLNRFFDRFCKGIMNGWERDTPPVRMSLLGCGSSPNIVERPEKDFPLPRQRLKTFYLDASTRTMASSKTENAASISHESHASKDESTFQVFFPTYTEICGYPKVKLWVSCPSHTDMDIVVQLRKISAKGTLLSATHFPCPDPDRNVPDAETTKTFGPQGFLRASTACTRDEERSSADGQEVFYRHDRGEELQPGVIMPVEITLWPIGLVFAPGEGLLLRVAGRVLAPQMGNPQGEVLDENVGVHVVYTGGAHGSCLVLPFV